MSILVGLILNIISLNPLSAKVLQSCKASKKRTRYCQCIYNEPFLVENRLNSSAISIKPMSAWACWHGPSVLAKYCGNGRNAVNPFPNDKI